MTESITGKKTIKVMCVDDHPLVREGIATVIRSQSDLDLVAVAPNGHTAIQLYREQRPDVVLMDLRLPDISGIDAMVAIRADFPDAKIIILTTFEGDVEIRRSLQSGARGYMLKTAPPKELVEAIRLVHAGKRLIPPELANTLAEHVSDESLSNREIEVLRQVANGKGNREIGEILFISEETVKAHLKHILEKLDADDRTQAVTIALRRGIMHL
jgi:DNA-binding NarL/FixJ family response regulator